MSNRNRYRQQQRAIARAARRAQRRHSADAIWLSALISGEGK